MTSIRETWRAGLRSSPGGTRPGRSRPPFKQVTLWVVLPALVMVVLMRFAPAVFAGAYSFTDWDGLSVPKFIGLDNFVQIFTQDDTRRSFFNTLLIAAGFVVVANALGLFLAVSLNRLLKTRHLLRSLFFLPVALSSIATAYIWRFIFDYNGLLNQVLATVGLGHWRQAWLNDPSYALWAIVAAGIWQWAGLAMIMYLAGLQAIPEELYEAAATDGVGPWQTFRYITFPLLAPSVTVTSTLLLEHGLRLFDLVLGMTGGGPANATQTLATELWQQSFVNGHYGFGASIGVLLTLLVVGLAFLQVALLRLREGRY